jgi:transposase InsO family protein
MRAAAPVGASRRRGGVATTRLDREARPRRTLSIGTSSPRSRTKLWVADPIFVPDGERVPLSRRHSRRMEPQVVGWSMANHRRADLAIDALEAAVGQRRPGDVIHHSDQASQYTSLAFTIATGSRHHTSAAAQIRSRLGATRPAAAYPVAARYRPLARLFDKLPHLPRRHPPARRQ